MKKYILLLVIMIFSGKANADWELVNITETAYIAVDRTTIRQQNGYTTLWVLFDFKKPQSSDGMNFHSNKIFFIFNCKNYLRSVKSGVFYSGQKGTGKTVYTFSLNFHELKFNDVVPGSIEELAFNIACKGK